MNYESINEYMNENKSNNGNEIIFDEINGFLNDL